MKKSDALSRVLLLIEFDVRKLANLTVLILGLGNVGSQCAALLALAGVGRLVLVDHDVVGPENLCSPVFAPKDLGKRKVDAVRAWIRVHAPWVEVVIIHADLIVGVPEYTSWTSTPARLATSAAISFSV